MKTPDTYKYPDSELRRTQKLFSAKKMIQVFKSRLNTQDRSFANGIRFSPRIFNRLDIGYKKHIDSQLKNIKVYDEFGNQLDLFRFDKFYIREGGFFGAMKERNKGCTELYFKYNEQLYSFRGFVKKAKDLSLDHVESMYHIVGEDSELKALWQLSEIVSRSDVDLKTKEGLDYISPIIKAEVSLDLLQRELEMIHEKTRIEIIPRRLNSALGKK